MSEKLRELIEAYANDDLKFYRAEDARMMERVEGGEDVFTGYYSDSEGNFYTPAAWEEELRQLYKETERLRTEKQRQAEAERQQRLAERRREEETFSQEKESSGSPLARPLVYISAVLFVVAVISFVYYINGDTPEMEADTLTETGLPDPAADTVFGDAIITGSSVRFRAGPSTEATILSVFEEEGERVQLISADTTVADWKHVKRSDGSRGWVYAAYVNDSI